MNTPVSSRWSWPRPGCARRGTLAVVCVAAAVLSLLAGPARAQEAPSPAPASSPDDSKSADQQSTESFPKFVVNGFLSQAYAISSGNQILGIPKAGTADYRTSAVQLWVQVSKYDSFSIQIGNDRLGDSPVQSLQPDVALDWLFYEHRFGAGSVKVGRVKIPFGIYNEIRDVGTLLPFYQPSADVYGIGSYTTQTVDGAAVSYSFALGGGWQLDLDAYGGNWEFVSITSEVGLAKSKARNTLGGEAWLTTPVPGLRFGIGGLSYTALTPGVPKAKANTDHASLEWQYGRVVTHLEYKYRHVADAKVDAGYAHVGVKLTNKITANAQVEYQDLSIAEFPLGTIHLDRDLALGVNYSFRSNLVLKLEHHWNKGFLVDPTGDLFAPARSTRYAIASLSMSF